MALLLYRFQEHGQGWQVEQRPDTSTSSGWSHGRDVSPTEVDVEEGADAPITEAPNASVEFISAATAAARRLDALELRRLLSRPHPLLSLDAWLRDAGLVCTVQGGVYAHERLLAERPAWQLALCANSETLALWRDEVLCLLSPRDNYAQSVAMWRCDADSTPHRRLLSWNVEETLLAACTSQGVVHILDAKARPLYTLPPPRWMAPQQDSAGPVPADADELLDELEATVPMLVGLAWRAPPKGRGFASELLLLGADATLRRISVPSAATTAASGASPSPVAPPLCLRAQHALVTCMSFDQASGLLVVGGGGSELSSQVNSTPPPPPPPPPPPRPPPHTHTPLDTPTTLLVVPRVSRASLACYGT